MFRQSTRVSTSRLVLALGLACALSAADARAAVGHDKSTWGGSSRTIRRPDLQHKRTAVTAVKTRIASPDADFVISKAREAGVMLTDADKRTIYRAFSGVVDRTARHFGADGSFRHTDELGTDPIKAHSGYSVSVVQRQAGQDQALNLRALRPLAAHLGRVKSRGAPNNRAVGGVVGRVARAVASGGSGKGGDALTTVSSYLRKESWMVGQWGWGAQDQAMNANHVYARRAAKRVGDKIVAGLGTQMFKEAETASQSAIQRAVSAPKIPVHWMALLASALDHTGYATTKVMQARNEVRAGKMSPGKGDDRLKAGDIRAFSKVLASSNNPADTRVPSQAAALDLAGMIGAGQ